MIRKKIGDQKNKTGHQEKQATQKADPITGPDACRDKEEGRYNKQYPPPHFTFYFKLFMVI